MIVSLEEQEKTFFKPHLVFIPAVNYIVGESYKVLSVKNLNFEHRNQWKESLLEKINLILFHTSQNLTDKPWLNEKTKYDRRKGKKLQGVRFNLKFSVTLFII